VLDLSGTVVIVTGGAHGIGAAYCRGFASSGCHVVVADIDAATADSLADEIRSRGESAIGCGVDVADFTSVKEMVETAKRQFGRVDVLLNNAAVFATVPMSRGRHDEIDEAEWDRLMAVNVKGVWNCVRAVVPIMAELGKGSIINVSSAVALFGPVGRVHYVASKGAVLAMTKTLAREVGPLGIRVNSLLPGSTLSEEKPTPEIIAFRQRAAGERAIPRVQTPEDMIGPALFLASDLSGFVTGQALIVDGGREMH
jgi:3-oxoacyl-[acyl-carrier protein] reductase